MRKQVGFLEARSHNPFLCSITSGIIADQTVNADKAKEICIEIKVDA